MNISPPLPKSAHPLFPPHQVFLWLPGLAGDERPYCTYNEFRPNVDLLDFRRSNLLPEEDDNGAHFVSPYPVSQETHICWHTNVSPPYPYHPIPISRSLSPIEIEQLGEAVAELSGAANPSSAPQATLINRNKHYILSALARMDLLPTGGVTHVA